MIRFRQLAAAALALAALGARAHDTWLMPQPAGRAALSFALETGERFPHAEVPTGEGELAAAAARVGTKKLAPARTRRTDTGLQLDFAVPARGPVLAWASLAPALVELDEKQVEAYFAEVDAPEHVRRAWAAAGPSRRWREVFVKHAKSLARAGDAPWSAAWAKSGQKLEIVPQPGRLRAGEELRVTVLLDGRPLPSLVLSCLDDAGRRVHKAPSDAAGEFACRPDRAGVWLVRGTELRRARRGGAKWESDWASLTLRVAP